MNQPFQLPAARGWLAGLVPCLLSVGLVACGGGGDSVSSVPLATKTAATTGFSNTTTYVVKNTGTVGSVEPKALNDKGQVAINRLFFGDGNPQFFDGASLHTIPKQSGASTATVLALNNNGVAAGYSSFVVPPRNMPRAQPTTWSVSDGLVDLSPGILENIIPRDINDAGSVIAMDSNGVRWTGGVKTVLSSSGSGVFSISQNGNATGYRLGNGGADAIIWRGDGTITTLGRMEGGNSALGVLVTDNDQVFGLANSSTGRETPFYWSPSSGFVRIPIPNATNYNFSAASIAGLNSAGLVVGNYGSRAYAWSAALGFQDLGTLGGVSTSVTGLSENGEAVGTSTLANGEERAFIWTPATGMVNLNTKIPSAPTNTVLYRSYAISNTGIIAALSNAGTVILTASSAAPSVGPIVASDPLAVKTTFSASATFADTDTADIHTAVFDWGDGTTPTAATVTAANGAGTFAATHAYLAAGIYDVTATVTDNTGKSASSVRQIVVYDPAAGFVTGGGWIQSPVGAYRADLSLFGRANFGFVSQYKKGATTPTGETQFEFQTAGLSFRSSSYEWLVVAGARAQYKGSGEVNGLPGYRFLLTGVDGAQNGTKIDRFRVKIWKTDPDTQQEVVIYDNQLSATGEGTDNEGTVLGGGNIAIHK